MSSPRRFKNAEDAFIDSVDDPITDYLPELVDRDARFRDITIRHLLMMGGMAIFVMGKSTTLRPREITVR